LALSLAIEKLDAGYGAVKALRGVTLHVDAGETVALLGTNGNGKSTLMKCVMGLVRPDSGRVSLTIDGVAHDLTKLSPEAIVDLGVALVPEGRRLFPKLTVTENLMLGAFRKAARATIDGNLALVFDTFPVLKERRHQLAGTMSGGQQQMLAIARALMSRPQLLLLDEPSLGLAPLIVKQIFEVLAELNKGGMTVFLVEQNAFHALKLAHRGYVMVSGIITMSGTGKELLARPEIRQAYLEGGRH
jgi:branched-chain amino acid transport system ATP-binding protein